MEYKCPITFIPMPPWVDLRGVVGVMNTIENNGFLYAGVNFDIPLGDHLIFTAGFAPGYYWVGHGKELGYPLEFRSGGELAYQQDNGVRYGVHFYHLSNAHLGWKNPGEESLVFFYEVPISLLK